MFEVPVLFIIFNRPDATARVFAELKKIKPKRLFISADGPRPDKPDDKEKCLAVRKIVEEGIDWECEVHKNFSEVNHGCGRGPYLGIDWFFKQVEEGIILEDDCLPHPTFFKYCEELLAKYRNEEKIMMISGDNFQNGAIRGDGSYYFSRYNHTWGWASWRRAWNLFDFEMKDFSLFEEQKKIAGIWQEKIVQNYWLNIFRYAQQKKEKDFWDHQWTFAIWNHGGLACLPNVNLISNIGFGAEATHTFFKKKSVLCVPLQEMKFPLIHPLMLAPDGQADKYEHKYIFKINLFRVWIINFSKKIKLFDLFKKLYLKFFRV